MNYQKSILLILIFFIIYLVISPLQGCSPRAIDYEQVGEEERIVVKFSHVVAENTPKGQAALRFAKLVEERTDGFVEVQVYPNSTLYMDGEEIEALQANNVQLIAPATAKMTEYFPELLVFDLPFLFNDYEDAHRFFESEEAKNMLEGIKGHKMLGLAMWDNGFKIMSANTPLISVEDFKDLNFRIMGNPILEFQFQQLGARTTTLPFNEVYEALLNKTVDGAENPPSNFYSKKFHEVQNYVTISDHGYLGYVVLTNQKFWENLPDNIRKILDDTLAEVSEWEREYAMYQNEKDLSLIKRRSDIEVYILSKEEREAWKETLMPMYNYFQHKVSEELVNSVRNN